MISNYKSIQYHHTTINAKQINIYLWMCVKFIFHAIGTGDVLHYVRISYKEERNECQFSLEIDVNLIKNKHILSLEESIFDFSVGFFECLSITVDPPDIFEHIFYFRNDSFKIAKSDNYFFFKKLRT